MSLLSSSENNASRHSQQFITTQLSASGAFLSRFGRAITFSAHFHDGSKPDLLAARGNGTCLQLRHKCYVFHVVTLYLSNPLRLLQRSLSLFSFPDFNQLVYSLVPRNPLRILASTVVPWFFIVAFDVLLPNGFISFQILKSRLTDSFQSIE